MTRRTDELPDGGPVSETTRKLAEHSLGDRSRLDGMTEGSALRFLIEERYGDSMAGKSLTYLRARRDAILGEDSPSGSRNTQDLADAYATLHASGGGLTGTRAQRHDEPSSSPTPRHNEGQRAPKSAREDMVERRRNAWRGGQPAGGDGGQPDARSARDRMVERRRNAWRGDSNQGASAGRRRDAPDGHPPHEDAASARQQMVERKRRLSGSTNERGAPNGGRIDEPPVTISPNTPNSEGS